MSTTPIRVGVLDARGLHVQGASIAPLSTPIAHVGDLYERARRRELNQLWITADGAAALGLPAEVKRQGVHPHAFISDAPAELRIFPRGGLAPWLALGHDRTGLAVVFPGYDALAPWDDAPDAPTLLAALLAYASALGRPYAWSPGRTGRDLIEEVAHAGGRKGWTRDPIPADAWPEPALQVDTVATTSRMRTLSPAERSLHYLHGYDKNAAWVGAAGAVELGLGELTELSGPDVLFDKKLPGYWRRPIRLQEGEWHCTPTVVRAMERGDVAPITQAFVWQRHTRALEHWYERLRDARRVLRADETPAGALAREALKRTYAVTISSFAGTRLAHERRDSDQYRPDWAHMIHAHAAANLSRAAERLAAAGVPPVALFKDALYIVSDDPNPETAAAGALRIGPELADFKVEAAAIPLERVLHVFDQGGKNRGIRALHEALRAVKEEGGQHGIAGA